MKVKVGTIAVIIFAMLSSKAMADNIQQLLQECNNSDNEYDLLHCAGRVSGIVDMMGLNGSLLTQYGDRLTPLRSFAVCSGKPVPSYGAYLQVFKNWAQSHPERWSDPDLTGVIRALRETWPCR